MNEELLALCKRAKAAAPSLSVMSTGEKNRALLLISEGLERDKDTILSANAADMEIARQNGTSTAMLDRLLLTDARLAGCRQGIAEVIALPDPVGRIEEGIVRDNGLKILKNRVPLGVIGIIYEARPNVTVDVAALCFKSGNVCILRGGKEALCSNLALTHSIRQSLTEGGFSPDYILLIESTDRQVTTEFMGMRGYVDCLIPRGGTGLIRAVVENAKIPVIETGAGLCHLYVDEGADLQQAAAIVDNAKTSRPSVCNSADCILVHSSVAKEFLPMIKALLDSHKVELRCCPASLAILGQTVRVTPAGETDFDTEFLDYILAVKVVDSLQEALDHIALHGTGHSEAILTRDMERAEHFLRMVDAAAVFVNASTRFTDGNVFGLGAEIGISTQKLHARGPMGLKELTTIKYTIYGNGQVR